MIKIKPAPNCRYCHGFGYVVDWTDWGVTTDRMKNLCVCVLDQAPEGREDEIELELPVDLSGIGE